MLDQFLVGRVDRISPEAPVPIVEFDHEENRIGGAGQRRAQHRRARRAVRSRRASSARRGGDTLRAALAAHGHRHDRAGRRRPDRPHDDEGARRDRRATSRSRAWTTRRDGEAQRRRRGGAHRARDGARRHGAGAIVVSDYLKGAITRRADGAARRRWRATRGVPLLVDPKIPHLDYYAGATLVTPNHHEAEIATHMRIRTDEDDARRPRARSATRAGCDGVLITRGEHGMWLLDDGVEGHLPATAREVADVTGAGDTVDRDARAGARRRRDHRRSRPPRQPRRRRRRRQVRPGDGARRRNCCTRLASSEDSGLQAPGSVFGSRPSAPETGQPPEPGARSLEPAAGGQLGPTCGRSLRASKRFEAVHHDRPAGTR